MWWQFQSSGQRCSCWPNHNKLNLTTAYNANGVSSDGLDRATALGTKASKGHFIQQLTLSFPIVKGKCIGHTLPLHMEMTSWKKAEEGAGGLEL